jgi:hypothetical protein
VLRSIKAASLGLLVAGLVACPLPLPRDPDLPRDPLFPPAPSPVDGQHEVVETYASVSAARGNCADARRLRGADPINRKFSPQQVAFLAAWDWYACPK